MGIAKMNLNIRNPDLLIESVLVSYSIFVKLTLQISLKTLSYSLRRLAVQNTSVFHCGIVWYCCDATNTPLAIIHGHLKKTPILGRVGYLLHPNLFKNSSDSSRIYLTGFEVTG